MSLARWVSAVAGTWLFISSAVLFAPAWERVNEGFVGVAIFLTAFVAMAYTRFRLVNTVLGLWAVLSPFILALAASAAAVSQVAAGLVVFTASLWPGRKDFTNGHLVPH